MDQAQRYRYLLVDVDGTLFDSRGTVSPRTLRALHRAVEAGLVLVLATGRTHNSLRRVTERLGLPPFHCITNGGAVALTADGVVRHTALLETPLWQAVVAALEAEGLAPVVFSHRHPEPPLFYVSRLDGNPHFAVYLERNRAWCHHEPALARTEVPRVVEVAALGRDRAFDSASARVLTRFAERTRCHSMMLRLGGVYGRISEFFAPGTSKWGAFRTLFPEAAGQPGCVIAIGDEANDIEMVRAAGLGVAMGNAIPALQDVADCVTADLDHDGVAAVLEAVLGEER